MLVDRNVAGKRLLCLCLLAAVLFIGGYVTLFSTSGEYYRTYSPDRQYSVYASKYYYERFMPRMPGQSGDAAGKVFLYDEVEKRVINSATIPILWMTEAIVWDQDNAYFKGTYYPYAGNPWRLPRPIQSARPMAAENDGDRNP